MNPTNDVFEKRVAALEGGVGALAFSSGSAAVTFSILNIAGAGDHIVSANSLYGGTYNLFVHTLPRFGIDIDLRRPQRPGELPPRHQAQDQAALRRDGRQPQARHARHRGRGRHRPRGRHPADRRQHDGDARTSSGPIDHGADIVVHSATKFIGGHGTSIGGVVVDCGKFDWGAERQVPRPGGARRQLPRPQVLRGARPDHVHHQAARAACCATSAPRSRRSTPSSSCRASRRCRCAWSATAPTRSPWRSFLQSHPKVDWVTYPGLRVPPRRTGPRAPTTTAACSARSSASASRAAVRRAGASSRARSCSRTSPTSATPSRWPSTRRRTTHSQLTAEEQLECGVTDDFVRLSVGIETHRRHHRRPRPGAGQGVTPTSAVL